MAIFQSVRFNSAIYAQIQLALLTDLLWVSLVKTLRRTLEVASCISGHGVYLDRCESDSVHMIEVMTVSQYKQMSGRKSKFGAIRTQCASKHIHDSKKEAVRCLELTALSKKGTISRLKQQVKFVLLKGFTYQGSKIRPLTYIADFTYYEKGTYIIEDVKGRLTEVYKIKKKLLLHKIRAKKACRFIET